MLNVLSDILAGYATLLTYVQLLTPVCMVYIVCVTDLDTNMSSLF